MTVKYCGNKRKGFTLAEILVTLGVIGVIASMTVPTLLQDIQDAQYKTAWKKSFADLNQVTIQIIQEKGGTLKNAFPNDGAGTEALKDAFAQKFNVIKNCSGTPERGGTGSGVSAEGCWHNGTGSWSLLNGTNLGSANESGLILNNGSFLRFKMNKSDCSYSTGDYKRCGWIYIDINGFKKPNKMGKDIFTVSITENSIIPKGARNWYSSDSTCIEGSTDPNNCGRGCSAKYLYE